MESLGSRIKKARIGRGLSVERLAKMLGVSRSCIYNWERDLRQPKHKNRAQLFREIGLAIPWNESEDWGSVTAVAINVVRRLPISDSLAQDLVGVEFVDRDLLPDKYYVFWETEPSQIFTMCKPSRARVLLQLQGDANDGDLVAIAFGETQIVMGVLRKYKDIYIINPCDHRTAIVLKSIDARIVGVVKRVVHLM